MNKKGIVGIIIIVVIILALVGVWFIWDSFTDKVDEFKNENNDDVVKNCIDAGQVVRNPSINPELQEDKICCSELVEIIEKGIEGDWDENCNNAKGLNNICSDCGNNICEEWETGCNCASDCN